MNDEEILKYIDVNIQGNNGNYRIQKIFNNEGANGTLFEAVDEDSSTVVVKILETSDKVKNTRFEEEIEFQSNHNCPNIVKALDFGEIKVGNQKRARKFYVMPKYKASLDKIIYNEVLSTNQCIKYILDLCNALRYIHKEYKHKIIHRDIKPQNILYDEANDKMLLGDFGICKTFKNITVGEELLGNFSYHAPEQNLHSNKSIDTYTDIYSLGLVINEIFTKEIPMGVDYKKIADVAPNYSFMDSIVSNMIKSNGLERESDIDTIISMIRYKCDQINEEKGNIEFNLIRDGNYSSVLKDAILNDFILANDLLNNSNTQWERLNLNYHCNIGYSAKQAVVDSAILKRLYEEIISKFNYECNSDYQEALDDNKDNYNKLLEILSRLKSFREFDFYKNKAKKVFFYLREYHQQEILDGVDDWVDEVKKYYLDVPILTLSYEVSELIKASGNSMDCDLSTYVVINNNRISETIEENNLYKEEVSNLKDLSQAISKKFSHATLLKDNFILIFQNMSEANDFESKIQDKIRELKEDVRALDLLDFLMTKNVTLEYTYYKLDLYSSKLLKKYIFNE